MQILELQMKNFGKFSNQNISFHDGINIIYGENEMGKSTIHAFIRGMLFGIDKMRGRASKNDEYMLRQPWENSGYFAGVMRFESGHKVFRIERGFSKADKRAVLICETDGEELDISRGDLQVLLEGLSEAAFRNTIFIRQNSSGTDEGLAAELRNYMANCESAGDDEIDVTRAVEALKLKRREIEAQKKQQDRMLLERLEQVQMRMDYVGQEIRTLKKQREENRSRLDGLQKRELREKRLEREERASIENQEREMQRQRKIRQAVLMAAAAAALLSGLFISHVWAKAFLWLAAVALLGFCWHLERMGRRKGWEKPMTASEAAEGIQKLSWNIERIQEELHEKQVIYENLRENQTDVRSVRGDSDRLAKELEALDLAVSTIQEISQDIYKQSAQKLNRTASSILNEITQGRYTSIYLDSNMQVRINTPQKLLYLEQVSRGTMDQINFALRMAAAQLFLKGEKMPLIFDDAFAMYDDGRLERTLRWLDESGSQVLLFTCHKREREILNSIRGL